MSNIKQFEHDLNDQSRAIESMLPPGLDLRRFMRTVSNTVQTHPQSERLLAADRQTLFSACQKAAGDGLLVDGRESTLTVFHDNKGNIDRVVYMPMVQGLVKLARNSNEISNIVSEVVYDKDGFTYRPGMEEQPLHEPDWFGERGQPIGAYAVVTLKDGEKVVSVLPKNRIVAIGQGGRNADQYIPGRGAHFAEWWKKTAIKNVLKYSPKSTYLESAMAADNELTDPDKIPPVEKEASPLKAALNLQGESLTVRKATEPPSARAANNRPQGEELASTESTPEKTTEKTQNEDKAGQQADRIRQKLKEQNQVPVSEPTEQDKQALSMALDSIASCNTFDQLEECGRDLAGLIHLDFKQQVIKAYRDRRAQLKV